MAIFKFIRTVSMVSLAISFVAGPAVADMWKPSKPITIVVGASAGGPLDGTARLIAKLLEQPTGQTVNVVNKTGGGHSIAMGYLNKIGRDGHALAMALTNLITNRIVGNNPLTYTDVTPIALLTSEFIGMSVKVDSPIKDAMDLIERMKKKPDSLTFAITNRAGGNHIAAGVVFRAAGIDLTKVKFVSFKGGAKTTASVIGGHVDVVMATPGSAWKYVKGGKLRMLAISAPERMHPATTVPTWRELGVDAITPNWRSIVAAKGLPAAQVAYWNKTIAAMVQSPEWQAALKKNNWHNEYRNSAETLKFMEQTSKELTILLTALGDVKSK
jgi:putative tricarboxylic transport membrane protein